MGRLEGVGRVHDSGTVEVTEFAEDGISGSLRSRKNA